MPQFGSMPYNYTPPSDATRRLVLEEKRAAEQARRNAAREAHSKGLTKYADPSVGDLERFWVGGERPITQDLLSEPQATPSSRAEDDFLVKHLVKQPGLMTRPQEPAPAFDAGKGADWMDRVNPGVLRDTALTFGKGMPRTTDPALRAQQDAADAREVAAHKAEQERRTIRKVVGPDGKVLYTNVGNVGVPVIQGGESVGPDVGAPGRGGLSMDPSAEARAQYENNMSPEAQAADAKARAEERMFEVLQKNPFAREQFAQWVNQQNQQAAIDRTYGQERAKSAAKLEALSQLDAMEQQALAEIEAGDAADGLGTPEAKQKAVEGIRRWREQREVALGLRERPDVGI